MLIRISISISFPVYATPSPIPFPFPPLSVYTVFATIDIPTPGGGPLGVFPIAMSVMVAHLFLLPIDGCSINPTRSFGPSLIAAMAGIGGTYYHQQYM
jgi:glycerol uptake facilitator-like aquaporin